MSSNNVPPDSDQIYAIEQPATPFKFDHKVAAVFPDMIKRSVPGYKEIIQVIQQLAEKYITQNSNAYDLGCSLGAASLALSYGTKSTGVKIIGIDNSEAMINRCTSNIQSFKLRTPIELMQADLQQVKIENASMVVLNYTLQFIPQSMRETVLKNIYQGMNKNGVLILSEKTVFEDPQINRLMIDLHHQFKRDNGYSELEISQKRNALETVLVPESKSVHINRLQEVGFSHASSLQQRLNFVSFIAIK